MKFLSILSLVIFSCSSFSWATESSRKPANSSWLKCVAYSPKGPMDEIYLELGTGKKTVLKYLGQEVEVGSSEKCGKDLQCMILQDLEIAFTVGGSAGSLKLHQGKDLLTEDWGRGDAAVFEISPDISYGGSRNKHKMAGICSRSN